MTNCINCGATRKPYDRKCPYCDTVFELKSFEDKQIKEYENELIKAKINLENIKLRQRLSEACYRYMKRGF